MKHITIEDLSRKLKHHFFSGQWLTINPKPLTYKRIATLPTSSQPGVNAKILLDKTLPPLGRYPHSLYFTKSSQPVPLRSSLKDAGGTFPRAIHEQLKVTKDRREHANRGSTATQKGELTQPSQSKLLANISAHQPTTFYAGLNTHFFTFTDSSCNTSEIIPLPNNVEDSADVVCQSYKVYASQKKTFIEIEEKVSFVNIALDSARDR